MRIPKYGKGLLTLAGLSLVGLLLACGSAQAPPDAAPTGPAAAGSETGLPAGAPAPLYLPAPAVSEGVVGVSKPQTAPAPQSSTIEVDGGIRASGRGQASAAPDLATLNLGVEAFATSVEDARTEAAEAMTDILEELEVHEIADTDIQTSHFNIQPRYTGREVTRCEEPEAEMESGAETGDEMAGSADTPAETAGSADTPAETAGSADTPAEMAGSGDTPAEMAGSAEADDDTLTESAPATPGSQEPAATNCYQEWQSVLTGYEVTNRVAVLVRDLDSISPIIDGVADAGGDLLRFHGVTFSIESTTTLQSQARTAAVIDLRNRATQLAQLGEVRLGALVYLTETSPAPSGRVDFFKESQALSAPALAGASTPIVPGELSVEVYVNGIFEIR